ncbi:hypothetical protein SPICUR_05320 [Spiribacter curvatus]|uniref:Uncharacterized protein n=1 Tax=Spiribacter curvatus TaxID=1335757 RepID=U5T3B5_9GAMM|nr:hypothetical protein SPICUR_05320 [Spiribacter curvatus]
MSEARDYYRWRVLAALFGLLVLILTDHFNSATFARNSGQAGVATSYSQLDRGACAPCGAPCQSED